MDRRRKDWGRFIHSLKFILPTEYLNSTTAPLAINTPQSGHIHALAVIICTKAECLFWLLPNYLLYLMPLLEFTDCGIHSYLKKAACLSMKYYIC